MNEEKLFALIMGIFALGLLFLVCYWIFSPTML